MVMNRIFSLLILLLSFDSYSQCLGLQTGAYPAMGGLTPAPTIVNGVPTYPANTQVTVCYTLQSFIQFGTNWLEGFDINLGPGWNPASITPINPPGNCGGNGSGGQWLWMNSVTSSATGLTVGPGWFFEANQGGPVDGNPGNDWGDQGTNCVWNFCFQITTNNSCLPNQNLYIAVTAAGDGNWGSYIPFGGQFCGTTPYVMLPNTAVINNLLPSLGSINHN
jgi:hypothetical protein